MLKMKLHNLSFDGQGDYFHPAPVQLADKSFLITMQQFLGSDHYACPLYSCAESLNGPWSPTAKIEAFESKTVIDGITEGIADPRPFNIPNSDKIIVFACNTYYSDKGALAWDKEKSALAKSLPQFPVYAVYSPDNGWSERKELNSDLMKACPNARLACTQIAYTADNKFLLPAYFQSGQVKFNGYDSGRFSVCVIKSSLVDDNTLLVEDISNIMSLKVERGFCEPSLYQFNGIYYLTIRAEDGHGYWSCSKDPMNFPKPSPWQFDDGEYLAMSSTQQHWFQVQDKLYLAYTRNAGYNAEVIRFRTPLFAAEFDTDKQKLVRESEKVILPYLIRDGVYGLLGNFHCLSLDDGSAIISDAALFLNRDSNEKIYGKSEVFLAQLFA